MISEVENQILEICDSIAESMGLIILECRFVSARNRQQIRIVLDKLSSSVTVRECASFSRQLSRVLDVEDPIKGSYNLEVSSPGFRRLIRVPEDINRFINHRVKIRLHEPVKDRNVWIGHLKNCENPLKLVTEEAGELEMAFDKIKQINLHE